MGQAKGLPHLQLLVERALQALKSVYSRKWK